MNKKKDNEMNLLIRFNTTILSRFIPLARKVLIVHNFSVPPPKKPVSDGFLQD